MLCLFTVLGVAILLALGVWQLERRIGKLDLMQRVDQRVHASPVMAPGPESWPYINAANDAYRHVQLTGRFIEGHEMLVQAVTERGAGYWLLAPFQTAEGFKVFVNRGYVPADRSQWHIAGREDEMTLTGLLRITEPGGGFLRHNDPARDRWYSRDVFAIAAARNIHDAAPYFVDADASVEGSGFPVGGLTVISFPNNHLLYAVTWFSIAAMLAGWSFYVARQEWRLRRSSAVSAVSG
ncbi:MAG TPA: SURF1 family protein [Afipia sp.]